MADRKSYIWTDAAGVMRVGQAGVAVDALVAGFLEGDSAETIRQDYPALSLEEVYGALAEYLANPSRQARPKTLFATHYHELTDLADSLPGVVNAHVAAREWKDDIIFLRKIVSGRSDRSYGIQVARLAGLPPEVITRARHILGGLERDELSRGGRPTLSGSADDAPSPQLTLFAEGSTIDSEIAKRLREIDVDDTTPRRALELLAELKKLAGDT